MLNLALYQKNLELFARDNPEEAHLLAHIDCSSLHFCKTYEGELNLVDKSEKHPFYIHAQEGALFEAESWAKTLKLDADTLVVFGVGLGYYYTALKAWLTENSKRFLIFLEDDPRVLYHFLQTDLASEILLNPQVFVKEIPHIEIGEEGWLTLRKSVESLTNAFALSSLHVSALQSYFIRRFEFFHFLVPQWLLNHSQAKRQLEVIYSEANPNFGNFYNNIYLLREAVIGTKLFKALDSIPAIICGAGPSMEKQLSFLNELRDRSLIIASGSAVNVLTNASVFPHAAGGIDPTATQTSRLLTSFAYEVPVFYQSTFYPQALATWHGPLIYMTLSSEFPLFSWFDREFGIEDPESTISGVSTSNFLLETIVFLRCNPIILTGMDLAYTEDRRYAKGVSAHKTEKIAHHEEIETKTNAVMPVLGVDGKEVQTKLHWIVEASHITDFHDRHPESLLLNATEGGMPVLKVPNETLRNVAAEHLNEVYDIQGWLHGTIENIADEKISEEKIQSVLNRWREGLVRCQERLTNLIKTFQEKVNSNEFYPEPSFLMYGELATEPVYNELLLTLNRGFNAVNAMKFRAIKFIADRVLRHKEELRLEIERCLYLQGHIKEHLKQIEEGKKSNNYPRGLKKVIKAEIPKIQKPQDGQKIYFYPKGTIKVEAFFKDGKLNGPWTFFSENGDILYTSDYVNGKKMGDVHLYYKAGSLYGKQHYKEGELDGESCFYFSDGALKTTAFYSQGKLDGVVGLYYSNGQIKKEQHFSMGSLSGVEKLWDVYGKLIAEVCY